MIVSNNLIHLAIIKDFSNIGKHTIIYHKHMIFYRYVKASTSAAIMLKHCQSFAIQYEITFYYYFFIGQ